MLGDIRQTRWLYIKAGLFLALGLLASALVLVEHFSWRNAALLALAVWAFCRAYYFAFYVIQHYADPQFRYSGLLAFIRYAVLKRARRSVQRRT